MKTVSLLFVFTLFVCNVNASHNRGGRIEVKHLSGLTYEITIITYTKTSSYQADRPQLDSVYLGDSPNPTVFVRDTFADAVCDMRINIYTETHTYPGPGRFKIYFTDPGRTGSIANMMNSVAEPMHLETEFTIDLVTCFDEGPHLYTYPTFCHPFQKNLAISRAGVDLNWDSLSYNLDTCMNNTGSYVTGYFIPTGVSLDPVSGTFRWNGDSMNVQGLFCFAIRVHEWRQGIEIGYVHEEFQVMLDNTIDSNYFFNTSLLPPDLATHVLPGDTFHLHVEYIDSSGVYGFAYYSDLTNYNWNYHDSGNIHIGDLSFIASQNEVRNDPFRILFRGKTDLTYLVYVDGSSNQLCRSVGVDELEQTSTINVYPNPTDGVINFDLKYPVTEMTLFNDIGEIVFQKNNFNSKSIDLGFLKSGIYFLRISDRDHSYFSKVIKQ